MTPVFTAHTVIDGASYHVVIERDGKQLAVLPPDVAQGLADQLEDAAVEPPVCSRGCGDYAVDRDHCAHEVERWPA